MKRTHENISALIAGETQTPVGLSSAGILSRMESYADDPRLWESLYDDFDDDFVIALESLGDEIERERERERQAYAAWAAHTPDSAPLDWTHTSGRFVVTESSGAARLATGHGSDFATQAADVAFPTISDRKGRAIGASATHTDFATDAAGLSAIRITHVASGRWALVQAL